MVVPERWAHQVEGLRRAAPRKSFGLFWEMGTGKTRETIDIFDAWCEQEGRPLRALILGPPIVVQNWKREFRLYSRFGEVFCLEGAGKDRAAKLKQFGFTFDARVFVTNYESLLMPELFELLCEWRPEVLICDESHKLKNVQAKRTKQAFKLSDIAERRLILTGTPVLNSPLDLFAQMRVLDGGELFGKNFFVFRSQYFDDKNAHMPASKHFPNWQPRAGAVEELNAKLKSATMVVKKSECLDLPPLVRQVVPVELSAEQKRLYKAMKDDFITYVGARACVATLAITKLMRLQQIVSGFIKLEYLPGEKSVVSLKENPRAKALEDILEDVAPYHKVLVWAVFRENYDAIRKVCDKLGLPAVELHGEVAAADRQKAVDDFNNDPRIRVFIGHPGSAGIGINLVSASYSIFYSRNFNLEQDLQAEARNYRGGSEIHEKITRIDLVARGTIDELICDKLASKVDLSESLLKDIAGAL